VVGVGVYALNFLVEQRFTLAEEHAAGLLVADLLLAGLEKFTDSGPGFLSLNSSQWLVPLDFQLLNLRLHY
jgi:hypothetical protein